MSENLDRWQGIETEYATALIRSPTISRARHVYDELAKYVFADRIPLILSQKRDGFARNGGRIYVCGSALEITTPECPNHLELVKWDLAADVYACIGAKLASQTQKGPVGVWKRSHELDVEVHRGSHESYSTRVNFHTEPYKSLLLPFIALRPLFTGAGGYVRLGDELRYVISPRSFLTYQLQVGFMARRGEAAPGMYRTHLRCGEMLKNEFGRLLICGITSYVMSAIESGHLNKVPPLAKKPPPSYYYSSYYTPPKRLENVSWEISLNLHGDWQVELNRAHNKRIKAIDYLQTYYLEPIEKVFAEREIKPHDKLTLDTFKFVLDRLDQGRIRDCQKYVQWVEQLYFLDRCDKLVDFRAYEREFPKRVAQAKREYGKDWQRVLSSFMYTQLNLRWKEEVDEVTKIIGVVLDKTDDLHERTLYEMCCGGIRGAMRRMLGKVEWPAVVDDSDVVHAVLYPPPNSRAAVRVAVMKEFGKDLSVWWTQFYPGWPRRARWSYAELDGWTKKKINELKRDIRASLEQGADQS